MAEHVSPVGEFNQEPLAAGRSLSAHHAREEEPPTQHKECKVDECLVCKILILGYWFIPIANRVGPKPQKNGWYMENNRQDLWYIQKRAASGCMISTCLLAAASLLSDADWRGDERKFHFGYSGKLGSLYVIPNQGVATPSSFQKAGFGTITGWIYSLQQSSLAKPYFWKGLAEAELGNPTHNGASGPSFDFIRSCLEECLKNHKTCWQGEPFVPKKLLHIEKNSHRLRLTTPTRDSPRVYAALSYCWGASEPLNTTRSTLHSREQGINWVDLPCTYQDAATVCIRLGIEYLWIDALCIVQDDKEDWAEQCPKMAQIYRSAYITIIASSSMGCQESFLAAPQQSSTVIETETADGYPSSVCIRRRIRSGIHCNKKEISFGNMYLLQPGSDGQLEPLEKRGWTLQEQDLASRQAVYVSGEVQWVCRSMTRCECFPGRRGPGRDCVVTPESAHFRWTEIVHRLSTRNFTYENNKLPALSGIATEIYHVTQSEYLAGLWMNDIQRQLPWITISPKPFPESYIAPRFSWASVSSEVFWPHMTWMMRRPSEADQNMDLTTRFGRDSGLSSSVLFARAHHDGPAKILSGRMRRPSEEGNMGIPGAYQVQYLTTVVSGDCSLSTLDGFGRVRGGSIKLFGPIMDGFIRSSPKLEIAYDPKHSSLKYGGSFCVDGPLKQTQLSSRGKPLKTVQRSDGVKEQSFDWTPIKLLVLQQRREFLRNASDLDEPFSFDTMALGVSSIEPECYQRLGLVIGIKLKDISGDKDWLEGREECIVIV